MNEMLIAWGLATLFCSIYTLILPNLDAFLQWRANRRAVDRNTQPVGIGKTTATPAAQ